MTTRRTFMISVAAASAAAISIDASAQTKVDEKNGQALALGYVHDTTKVNGKKYAKHVNTQLCSNCVLWQSKATNPWGNCSLFPGKQVNAKGWCSAWAKKT